jgi:hypothetical protein
MTTGTSCLENVHRSGQSGLGYRVEKLYCGGKPSDFSSIAPFFTVADFPGIGLAFRFTPTVCP